VPAASEAKVESKRAVESRAPVPVLKPPAPEIVSKPAEARAKDAPAAPIPQKRQETVKEPEKPAPVVPPKVAKTREEKKTVAKPPVSPPPEEKPAFVTPKIMPAPKVPGTPRRPADVEEEPQVWDARKLKPIGIGIAALLAISVSYVGVKALTKPSVKPPTIIARQSPAGPQQIPTTSETAPPQIAKAMESAAPVLTNSPGVPEAPQNGAQPIQSPDPAVLTLTTPATAPDATQNIVPPNQAATGNASATQKQGAAEQSTSRALPIQPQIAAKSEPVNPSNASGRSRSGGTSTRSASSGQTAAKSSGAGRSSTGRSSAASNAPPPSSARSAPRAPAPAKPKSQPAHKPAFEGGVPGG